MDPIRIPNDGASLPRILVTGGAGFLGSHLCELLLSRGCAVTAMDNFSTGRIENLAGIADDPNFTLVRHDVTTEIPWDGPLAAIAHLASPASPQDYLTHPIDTLRTGSIGTLNILALALSKGARLVYASTSETYGDPEVHPQTEEYWGKVNPVGPRAVYDESKRFGEAAVAAYRRTYGLNTGIVRIFNTYGPRMRERDGRVMPAFIHQSLTGAALTINGTGAQTRSFCYVDDLVAGIAAMVESSHPGPVNLGNPDEVTVLELATLVRKLTGSNSPIALCPAMEDDPTRRRPDISRAQRLLGWEPAVGLTEGILRTVTWFAQTSGIGADFPARLEETSR